MIDMDESFSDFKARCPEAAARIMKSVEEKQGQELLQEAKRLHKKRLTDKELFDFLKNQKDKLILEQKDREIKKN